MRALCLPNYTAPVLNDAPDVPSGSVIDADVCIIGSGPAGIALASELAAEGVGVLILESGGVQPSKQAQALARGRVTAEAMFQLEKTRIRALGGTSNHWMALGTADVRGGGMRCARLDPIDFERRPWVAYSGWPFDYQHLEPFYDRAEAFLGLRPRAYAADDWFDPGEAPSIGGRIDLAILQIYDPAQLRRDAERISTSTQVTVLTNATVLALEFGPEGRHAETALVSSGPDSRFRARARTFVLAAGGIENARLLLLSVPEGSRARNDNTGRFFMEHPAINSPLIALSRGAEHRPRKRNDHHFISSFVLSEKAQREEALLNASLIVQPAPAAMGTPAGLAFSRLYHGYKTGRVPAGLLTHARRVMTSPLDAFKAGRGYLRNRWTAPGLFSFVIKVEQAPNPESRVVLSAKLDRLGQPMADLRWRIGEADMRTYARVEEIVEEELVARERPGFRRVSPRPPPLPWASYHHIGTTRMGGSAADSVVDADCLVHGLDNIYAAGSSVFPTSGQANPTLTIIALAIRLADHLRRLRRPAGVA